MDVINSTKTIVGSLLKSLDHAKIYGTMDSLEDLYLLKIINDYLLSCCLDKTFDTEKQLIELVNKIKIKNEGICIYRSLSDSYHNSSCDNRVTKLNQTPFK